MLIPYRECYNIELILIQLLLVHSECKALSCLYCGVVHKGRPQRGARGSGQMRIPADRREG